MKLLHKTISYLIEGMKVGALTYLIVLATGFQPTPPTFANIISVLLMSACIGLLNFIFWQDFLPFWTDLIIHFVAVTVLMLMMTFYNGWGFLIDRPHFWIVFISIYVLTWLLFTYQMHTNGRKINKALQERKQKNSSR